MEILKAVRKSVDPIEVVRVPRKEDERLKLVRWLAIEQGLAVIVDVSGTIEVYNQKQRTWIPAHGGDYIRLDLGAEDTYPIAPKYFAENFRVTEGGPVKAEAPESLMLQVEASKEAS